VVTFQSDDNLAGRRASAAGQFDFFVHGRGSRLYFRDAAVGHGAALEFHAQSPAADGSDQGVTHLLKLRESARHGHAPGFA
jgi:hypothetical protein